RPPAQGRGRDPDGEPARRDRVLGRRCGPGCRCRRGHRFRRGCERLCFGHAAADGPDPLQPAEERVELAGRMTIREKISGIGMTSQRTRARMVERLRELGIADEVVLAAMNSVPRHLFVEEALAHRAYENTPLPIGQGQTISQPYIVARMT